MMEPLRERYGDFCVAFIDFCSKRISLAQLSVLLKNGSRLEVVAASGHEKDITGTTSPESKGLAWHALSSTRAVEVHGVFAPDTQPFARPHHSVLIPMFSECRAIGTFCVGRRDGRLDGHDVAVAGTAACLLAHCIRGRRLALLADAFGTDVADVVDAMEDELVEDQTLVRHRLVEAASAFADASTAEPSRLDSVVSEFTRWACAVTRALITPPEADAARVLAAVPVPLAS